MKWLWILLPGLGGLLLYKIATGAKAPWEEEDEVEPKSLPFTYSGTREEFLQVMLDAVREVLPNVSPDVQRLIIAHAAYESGWGKSLGWKSANNPFNLTAISGPTVLGPDTECDANNNCVPITQKWAVFPSIAAGTTGYLKFIRASRYTDAYNRLTNGDVSFLEPLARGGYFTQPLDIYRKNFLSILKRVTSELDV